jgi:hypothetical protein
MKKPFVLLAMMTTLACGMPAGAAVPPTPKKVLLGRAQAPRARPAQELFELLDRLEVHGVVFSKTKRNQSPSKSPHTVVADR